MAVRELTDMKKETVIMGTTFLIWTYLNVKHVKPDRP
jgi:hypothetical protein